MCAADQKGVLKEITRVCKADQKGVFTADQEGVFTADQEGVLPLEPVEAAALGLARITH